MQFGRSKEDNVFALDFTGPFSPLAAFGVALVSAKSHASQALLHRSRNTAALGCFRVFPNGEAGCQSPKRE